MERQERELDEQIVISSKEKELREKQLEQEEKLAKASIPYLNMSAIVHSILTPHVASVNMCLALM